MFTTKFWHKILMEAYNVNAIKTLFPKMPSTKVDQHESFKRWLDVDPKEDTFDHATMIGWSSN
jgi:hypothetical protein